jgi:DNA polymerase-3 subunit gamma/tau
MNECKWSPQPRITLEVSLLSLCSLNFGAENNKAAVNLSSDAILEKIAFLEEKTTRLQTLINSLGAPQNFNAPKNTKIAKPFASESLPNAAIEKLLAERMDAPPIAEMEEGAPLEEKDAPAAWRMLLEKLKKDGQMAVYACVSQGRLQSYSGGVFTIAFKLPFLKARTEKSDYRELLEEILHKISGAKVRVKCVSEDSAPPPLKKADSARPPLDEMTAEEKQVLSAAEEIFGDNYVRKEDL